MPFAKIIAGHSSSLKAAWDYLTKDGRAVETDGWNLMPPERGGAPYWKQMDDLRARFGSGEPLKRRHEDGTVYLQRARTFQHIIISPDPRDSVDLDTLQELTEAFVERYFDGYMVAIAYHEDNENHVPHAHLLVNNYNMDTGKRVTSEFRDNKAWYRMTTWLQKEAQRLGMRYFEDASEDGPDRSRPSEYASKKASYRKHDEKAIIADGRFSWMEDLRSRANMAFLMSSSEQDYLDILGRLGVDVEPSKNGKEWIYRHPGKPETWKARGSRLGSDYTKWGYQRRLAYSLGREDPRPSAAAVDSLLGLFSTTEMAGEGTARYLGMLSSGTAVTAADVAAMLDFCRKHDIRSMGDFEALSKTKLGGDAREQLGSSWSLARDLGFLPEERSKAYGERGSSKKTRRKSAAGGGAAPTVEAPKQQARSEQERGEDR